MQREESLEPKDWLLVAEKDMARVAKLLGIEEPEAAGLYLQQAVEKFLKALLLTTDWDLKKTHSLPLLLQDATTILPNIDGYRTAMHRITAFYFADRYPATLEMGPSPDDVRQALVEVTPLIDTIRQFINEH